MVLGIMDRFSHQGGHENYESISGNTQLFNVNASGDILHVCLNNGTYFLEGTPECPTNDSRTGVEFETNDGPLGVGEFYCDDFFDVNSGTIDPSHLEVSLGGLALLPGTDEVVSTVYDPLSFIGTGEFRTQGIHWYSTQTGKLTDSYKVVESSPNDVPGGFGKGGGLAEAIFICEPAPLEIGNYVWEDANGDGIQDACERGIANVTIELLRAGTVIASTQTDTNGQYYFSDQNATDPNLNWTGTGFDIALQPDTTYVVRISNAEGGSQQAALSSFNLTTSNANNPTSDFIDSDGVLSSNDAEITFMTAGVGSVDHSLDFGFTSQPIPSCALNIIDTEISSCQTGVFTTTLALGWQDAPTGSDFEYSIDGATFQTILRNNPANTGMDTIQIAGLVCEQAKMVELRFEDDTTCYAQIQFVFPPANPAGYIYCAQTGEIVTGGTISVIPPAGGIVSITDDGSSGRYSWVITGSPIVAGIYTMSYTPPGSSTNTGTPGGFGDGNAILDPNNAGDNPANDDPLIIGSDVNGAGTMLNDFSPAANPFFLQFDLEAGDPFVDLNNLPLDNCSDCAPMNCFGVKIQVNKNN